MGGGGGAPEIFPLRKGVGGKSFSHAEGGGQISLLCCNYNFILVGLKALLYLATAAPIPSALSCPAASR